MSDLAERKAHARAAARAARAGIAPESRAQAARLLAEQLVALPELTAVRLVLAYGATPEELDPEPAAASLRERGVRVAYPRVAGPGVLTLHEVSPADLVPGSFGLCEPAAGAPEVSASELDAVLVPGVAFDARGRRLGYGGGFYDRLIPSLPSTCAVIGIAFDEQILPEVPAEDHDARVALVVTPTCMLRAE